MFEALTSAIKGLFVKERPQFEPKVKSPDEIFKELKNSRTKVTPEGLEEYKKNLEVLAAEFIQTGQYRSLEKIAFLIECVEKEKKVLEVGVDEYIFRDDIDTFLQRRNVKESSIKLISLRDYPRQIPPEIQEKIKKTKKLFDQMYVLFTDYTSTVTRNYQREQHIKARDRDPILFGVFESKRTDKSGSFIENRLLNDKFYCIGDWVDEYCDLTLDKFVAMSNKPREEVIHPITQPVSIEEIRAVLDNVNKEGRNVRF